MLKQLTYYDGAKVFVIRLFSDDSYRICGTDGKLVEMGDRMFLMSQWARKILSEARPSLI